MRGIIMSKKFIVICGGLLFTLGRFSFCLHQKLTDISLSKIVGGCAPCLAGSPCGGAGGGMGTCTYYSTGCEGECSSSCPSGPANEYCGNVYNSCYRHSAYCSTRTVYKCFTRMYSMSCYCDTWGTGPNCGRTNC